VVHQKTVPGVEHLDERDVALVARLQRLVLRAVVVNALDEVVLGLVLVHVPIVGTVDFDVLKEKTSPAC